MIAFLLHGVTHAQSLGNYDVRRWRTATFVSPRSSMLHATHTCKGSCACRPFPTRCPEPSWFGKTCSCRTCDLAAQLHQQTVVHRTRKTEHPTMTLGVYEAVSTSAARCMLNRHANLNSSDLNTGQMPFAKAKCLSWYQHAALGRSGNSLVHYDVTNTFTQESGACRTCETLNSLQFLLHGAMHAGWVKLPSIRLTQHSLSHIQFCWNCVQTMLHFTHKYTMKEWCCRIGNGREHLCMQNWDAWVLHKSSHSSTNSSTFGDQETIHCSRRPQIFFNCTKRRKSDFFPETIKFYACARDRECFREGPPLCRLISTAVWPLIEGNFAEDASHAADLPILCHFGRGSGKDLAEEEWIKRKKRRSPKMWFKFQDQIQQMVASNELLADLIVLLSQRFFLFVWERNTPTPFVELRNRFGNTCAGRTSRGHLHESVVPGLRPWKFSVGI